MGGILGQLGNVLSGGLVNKVIDKVLPDRLSPEDKAKFEQEFEKALLEKESEIIKGRTQIITEEAKSDDPYVSRARPTFLWIMYFVIVFNYIFIPIFGMIGALIAILFSKTIPTGIFVPIILPDNLWDLFTYGFLGYVGFRTVDKTGILNKFTKK